MHSCTPGLVQSTLITGRVSRSKPRARARARDGNRQPPRVATASQSARHTPGTWAPCAQRSASTAVSLPSPYRPYDGLVTGRRSPEEAKGRGWSSCPPAPRCQRRARTCIIGFELSPCGSGTATGPAAIPLHHRLHRTVMNRTYTTCVLCMYRSTGSFTCHA